MRIIAKFADISEGDKICMNNLQISLDDHFSYGLTSPPDKDIKRDFYSDFFQLDAYALAAYAPLQYMLST